MKTVNTLENLKHKEKTVDNLIEYITNRVDENSNYCLFLGSGASVNSNIKSGEQLVEEWREQIFFQERPDEKYDKNEAKNILSKNILLGMMKIGNIHLFLKENII